MSRTRIYRQIEAHRYVRGEVCIGKAFISKVWLMQRIEQGMTPQQIADEVMCCKRTILRRMHQYGIPTQGRGNPQLRGMSNYDYKRISDTKEGNDEALQQEGADGNHA